GRRGAEDWFTQSARRSKEMLSKCKFLFHAEGAEEQRMVQAKRAKKLNIFKNYFISSFASLRALRETLY
ncbi:MAG: hypothetical protein ACXWCT_14975, partial [Flavitalea sp.]